MSDLYHNVASVLSGRELIALAPGQGVRAAAEILTAGEVGAAPVLTDGRLVGVLSERDIVRKVVVLGRDANSLTVADIMTLELQTVTADVSLVEAFGIMVDGTFRHLPVVDADGKVIAMLSMRDIAAEHRIMYRQWIEWTERIALTG